MTYEFTIAQTNYYRVVAEDEAKALDAVYAGEVDAWDQDHEITGGQPVERIEA